MLVIENRPDVLVLKDTEKKKVIKALVHLGKFKNKINFEEKEIRSIKEFNEFVEELYW